MVGVGAVCELMVGEGTAVSNPAILIDPDIIWQVGDLTQLQISLPLPQDLAEGHYPLQLHCQNGARLALPDSLMVSDEGQRRLVGQRVNAQLGEAIQLQDIRYWLKGSQLTLSLHWLAEAAPEQELKLFVHLLDEQGVLVRQVDTVPCDWQCPTSQWQAEQQITDEATLDLWGLPPGSYQFALGLYDANSGERLPLVLENGTAVANNSFVLPERMIITSAP
jgi:hypothetical protein